MFGVLILYVENIHKYYVSSAAASYNGPLFLQNLINFPLVELKY